MVCPDIEVTTSPGFEALCAGIFSTAGTTMVRFSLGFISAIARIVPITEAAPHMSYFISSIPAPGLSEIPPLSNVTPLPTNTIGFEFASPL